jgi:hypothetical protein
MLMKREAHIATNRRKVSLAIPGAPNGAARPIPAQPPLGHTELVRLLQRLRDELEEFLNGIGVGREPSRNRESSRRI